MSRRPTFLWIEGIEILCYKIIILNLFYVEKLTSSLCLLASHRVKIGSHFLLYLCIWKFSNSYVCKGTVKQIGKTAKTSDKLQFVDLKCILQVSENLLLQPFITLYLFTDETWYSLKNVCFLFVLN